MDVAMTPERSFERAILYILMCPLLAKADTAKNEIGTYQSKQLGHTTARLLLRALCVSLYRYLELRY